MSSPVPSLSGPAGPLHGVATESPIRLQLAMGPINDVPVGYK